jgi:hypothetical protein
MTRSRLVGYGLLIAFLVLAGTLTYKHRVLEDDQRVIEAIKADSRVNYSYIELGAIYIQMTFQNPTVYPPFTPLPGFWVRMFTAWQYPRDSVALGDNMRIVGLVDDGFRVTIIARMSGASGFY